MRFLFVGSGLCLQQRPFNSAAIGFLQIPPHDGHPCLWLTLPAVGRARDFHPIERALVGRTIEKRHPAENGTPLCIGVYTGCAPGCLTSDNAFAAGDLVEQDQGKDRRRGKDGGQSSRRAVGISEKRCIDGG